MESTSHLTQVCATYCHLVSLQSLVFPVNMWQRPGCINQCWVCRGSLAAAVHGQPTLCGR